MVYTVLLCLFVFFCLWGMMSLCYIIGMLLRRPKRNFKSIVIMPLCDDDRENVRRIMYAEERINIFGENQNVEIIAVADENKNYRETERSFRDNDSIRFAHINDVQDILAEMTEQGNNTERQ